MESSREKSPTAQLLESALGLKFRDRELLRQALVHRSLLNEQGGQPEDSYERLEYLGDAVLELTVSTELFRRFPVLNEGALTKLRSALVRGESLAKVARRLSLGDFLLLGKGEENSGGRQRDSIAFLKVHYSSGKLNRECPFNDKPKMLADAPLFLCKPGRQFE